MSENNLTYREKLTLIRQGLHEKTTGPKPKKYLKKVSDKRAKKLEEQKTERVEDETMKEKWFKARRKEMIGRCQCGCMKPSSKKEDDNFRSSICHIFPQRDFESVQFHPLNWVERAFWADDKSGSCHTNMDNRSMDLWVNFADFDDIKERFYVLAPLLTDEERATKFYRHLESLIYKN